MLNGKGGSLFKVKNYNDLSNKISFYFKNKKIQNKKIKFAQSKLYRFDYSKNLSKYYEVVKKYI